MNDCDRKLAKLVEYMVYLLDDNYKIYNRLNKGHLKILNKLLKSFCKEYTSTYGGYYE